MEMSEVSTLVRRYLAAWNEAHIPTRKALLDQCWTDDATYLDPSIELNGLDTLLHHITKVQAARPGARLELMSGVDVHHNVLRFLWRMVHADGTYGSASIDFGEIGPDGRLIRIVGFFGPAPAI